MQKERNSKKIKEKNGLIWSEIESEKPGAMNRLGAKDRA